MRLYPKSLAFSTRRRLARAAGLAAMACVAAVALPARTASADPIALTGFGYALTDALDTSPLAQDSQTANPGYGHFSHTATAGGERSTVTYDFSTTSLNIGFDQLRDGSAGARAQAYAYFSFQALEDTTYNLSGQYSVDDFDNQHPSYAYLHAYLFDASLGMKVFESEFSYATVDPQLSLDLTQNTAGSLFTGFGSLTGAIQAGHYYQLHYNVMNQSIFGDGGASGDGNISLTFGSASTAAPVPLPGVAWMGLALLGGLGIKRGLRLRLPKA